MKAAGRDFTYLIVVLIGLGVTGESSLRAKTQLTFMLFFYYIYYWAVCVPGGLLYVVFQELFSSSSPNKIYGKAFKKVQLDPEVRSQLAVFISV